MYLPLFLGDKYDRQRDKKDNTPIEETRNLYKRDP